MSAAPRSTGWNCSARCSPRSKMLIASRRRPCARRMSASAIDRAQHVGVVPGPLQAGHGVDVQPARRVEVPARPVRESQEGGGRSAREMVVLAGEVQRAPGVRHRARDITPDQGRAGAVHRDRGRQRAERRPRRRRPSRPRSAVGSSHRSACRSRTSTPSKSPRTMSEPTRPTVSTGRTRNSSSGSASSQRRSVASCRLRRSSGIAGSIRSAARSKSSPASAWCDRLGPLAVLLVPVARPPVQVPDPVGLLVQQVRLQDVGEQVVVAVPAPAVVERHQEQVGPVEGLQHRLAVVLAGDGVAQRAAQPAQDRGLQQEAPDLLGLTLQHLLGQVVDDVAVVPGEARDEAGDVVPALHRQRRQLERGDPPLGAPLQRCDVLRRQGQSHRRR